MTALGRTLPPMPGEPPQGFVSRLARLFDLSAQEFCHDMALPFQGVVDGRSEVLAAVAHVARCDVRDLSGHALAREGDLHRLRGQEIDRPRARRTRLHVCVACLRADIAASSLPPEQAAYVRAEWLIDPIRTCRRHDLTLVALAGDPPVGVGAHDFAARLAPVVADLDAFDAAARPRRPSSLESYLLARIDRSGPAGSEWLDSLAFHVASKTCEMIGAVALHGRMQNLHHLTDDDWWAAGAAGFVVADGGPASVRTFLRHLQDTYDFSGPEGPQAVFGRLYQHLAFSARSAAFDPVRAVVAEHVIDTMPMAPGEEVLGHRVENRVVHSLASAAAETGRHPKRLRNLLTEAGIVPAESVDDAVITFRADVAAEFLASVSENLGLAEAGEHINAPRVQMKLIADAGLVTPIVERKLGYMRAFARTELDGFLRRLTHAAMPGGRVGANIQDLPTTAHRAHQGVVDIIRMILAGRLAYVGKRADVEGYMAVLVDVDEIKRSTRGAELDGLLAMHIIREVGLSYRTVNALLSERILPSHSVPHPVKRYAVTVVKRQDLEEFKREYASLLQLSHELGCHHIRLKSKLEAFGVGPCFPPEKMHCTFYRREDVLAAQRQATAAGSSLAECGGQTSGRYKARNGQTSGGSDALGGQASGEIVDRPS